MPAAPGSSPTLPHLGRSLNPRERGGGLRRGRLVRNACLHQWHPVSSQACGDNWGQEQLWALQATLGSSDGQETSPGVPAGLPHLGRGKESGITGGTIPGVSNHTHTSSGGGRKGRSWRRNKLSRQCVCPLSRRGLLTSPPCPCHEPDSPPPAPALSAQGSPAPRAGAGGLPGAWGCHLLEGRTKGRTTCTTDWAQECLRRGGGRGPRSPPPRAEPPPVPPGGWGGKTSWKTETEGTVTGCHPRQHVARPEGAQVTKWPCWGRGGGVDMDDCLIPKIIKKQ